MLLYFCGREQRLAYTGATHPSITFQVIFENHCGTRARVHARLLVCTNKMWVSYTIGQVYCCRTAAFDNLGILETSQDVPLITMLKKKGRRAIENAETIMDHLRAKYSSARFEMLEGEDIAIMSVKQQVS